jgi:hypothetical protein
MSAADIRRCYACRFVCAHHLELHVGWVKNCLQAMSDMCRFIPRYRTFV